MATRTEIERISVVETKVDTVLGELDKVNKKLDDLDKKFAAKWVQTIVSGLVAAILLGFIGVVVAFFIPQNSNNPTTSQTTTTNTPTGSTSTTSTKDGTPSASANASATSNDNKESQSVTDGVVDQLPKVTP